MACGYGSRRDDAPGILSRDLKFPEIESISVMYPPHSPWLLAIERSLGFDGFSNLAKR
jgi:hypothetical protein